MKQLTTYIVACLWCWATLVPLHAQGLKSFLSGGVASAPIGDPITFIAATTSTFATTRSPTINYPTGVAGDIWITIICVDGTASFNGAPPTDWTKLDEVADSLPDSRTCVYWYRAVGGEGSSASWTNITDATESGSSIVLVYRNCKATGSPFNTQGTPSGGGASTPHSLPAVTTTVDNCMVVSILGIDPGSSTRAFTWSTGSEVIGYATTPSGVNEFTSGIFVGQLLKTPAGVATLSGSFDGDEHANKFTYVLEPQ